MLNLPQELISLIYEFSPEHREFHSKNFDSIKQRGIHTRIRHLELLCDEATERDDWDFESIYKTNCSDLDHFVNVFSRCKCCEKHMKDAEDANCHCRCCCRHYTRIFTKIIDGTMTAGDPYSTLWANEN